MEVPESGPCSCPICDEQMVSLLQLNKHIDDVHTSAPESSRTAKIAHPTVTAPSSRNLASPTPPPGQSRAPVTSKSASRGLAAKKPETRLRAADKGTKHKPKAQKPPPPPKFVDLTAEFSARREKCIEQKQIAQSSTQRRFIKLANLMAESYIWHKNHTTSIFSYIGGVAASPFSKEKVLDAQKEIVGLGNWQDDSTATHCPQCFAKFNFIVRKHHCRLCGAIVNDGSLDSADAADFCSVQVPVSVFLQLLPNLNYSPSVRENWAVLLAAKNAEDALSRQFSFRCCRSCKDLLLSGNARGATENPECLDAYNGYLEIKGTILGTLARYEQLVGENKDADNVQINKLRVRLQKSIKDLELIVNSFMRRFFRFDAESQKFVPVANPALVSNMHKACTTFLQESILQLKRLNDEFSQSESRRLAGQLESAGGVSAHNPPVVKPEPPRLTKKQIREMREQLMVLNEQAFIVGEQVEESRKARKFDEMAPLKENLVELQHRIDEVVAELGEFGF